MNFLEACRAAKDMPTDNVLIARPNGPRLVIAWDGSIAANYNAGDGFYLGDILDMEDWQAVTMPLNFTPEDLDALVARLETN